MTINNWKKCKLGDVVDIIMGTSPKGCDINEIGKGRPFFQGSAEFSYRYPIVKKYTTKPVRQAKRGDILFSVRAPIADINIAPTDCAIGRGVAAIRSKAPDLQRYIEFVLKGTRNEWEYLNSSGSVFGCAKKEDLLNFEIPWNDEIDVLLTISRILGSLDDKIELLQKQNKTLEDMAKALFKSWFVDFDVVRAKQKGRPKADIMREYHLTEELYDLFPSSFADSPLGPIPSGWEVKPLSKIAVLTMGQSPAGTTYNETGEGLPFYQGRTDFGFRFPKKRIYCSAPTRIAEKGDILISVRAPVGDLNMANETCCIGRGVASIRSNISKDSFLYYAMLSAQTQFDVFNTEGTVFGSINRKDLSSFSILTPIEQLVKEFNNIIGNFDLKIEENLKQIQTLTELRDTLLPRLISGKIRG